MFHFRHFFALVAVVVKLSLAGVGGAADPKPVRVGVLGIDNYQAVAFTSLFKLGEE